LFRSSPLTGASASQFNIPATQRVRRINSRSLTLRSCAFSTRRASARIRSNLASNRSHPCGGLIPARATKSVQASADLITARLKEGGRVGAGVTRRPHTPPRGRVA
jgi:hypothetical protein